MMKRFLPFAIFASVAVLCALPLLKKSDPRILPSALVGKPVPVFDLGALSQNDLKGKTSVVNFFASWCIPCAAEQKVLDKMARQEKIPLYGIAYKDKKSDTKKFLAKHGNPFAVTAHDETGRVAIDWGVYGVPETFVVSKTGIILYRHTGAVTEKDYMDVIRPYLRGGAE